jgi:hypothetical protein
MLEDFIMYTLIILTIFFGCLQGSSNMKKAQKENIGKTPPSNFIDFLLNNRSK